MLRRYVSFFRTEPRTLPSLDSQTLQHSRDHPKKSIYVKFLISPCSRSQEAPNIENPAFSSKNPNQILGPVVFPSACTHDVTRSRARLLLKQGLQVALWRLFFFIYIFFIIFNLSLFLFVGFCIVSVVFCFCCLFPFSGFVWTCLCIFCVVLFRFVDAGSRV